MTTRKQKQDAPEQQIPLLQIEENWKEHAGGLPSFKQENQQPYKSVTVHFQERKDMVEFSKLIKQEIKLTTKYVWFPESEIQVWDKQWISENKDEEIIDQQ